MEAITKRIVTAEFSTEAVKRVIEQGQSAVEVARRLNISYQTRYNWVALANSLTARHRTKHG